MAECLDELSLVSRAVLAVSEQMPVRQALQVIVDSARSVAGARYAALGVPDAHGSFGEFVVSGLTAAQQRAIGPLPRQHGMLAELLRGGQAERLPDITADPRFGGWLPAAHPPMGAFLGVPVRRGGEVLGIIFAADKVVPAGAPAGGEFTARDEELLTLFAAHAAIALTNARLHEDSRELAAAQERARLAGELHDAVSQKLFSVRAHARAAAVLAGRDLAGSGSSAETNGALETSGALETNRARETNQAVAAALTTVSELAGQAQAELRAIIEGLAPPALDGLVTSLRRYADLAARAHGVPVAVTARAAPSLDPATEAAVYRVAQEALHNALRHAAPARVTIALSGTSRRVVLSVTDDGTGFDPAAPPGAGLGLASMRQRAAAVHGTVRVTSAPGKGTVVRLEAPAVPR